MKTLFLSLCCLLLGVGTACAKRLQVGVRAGMNLTDYKFDRAKIGDLSFSPGAKRPGFEAGAVLRLNLSQHLHLQSEFNYVSANYAVRMGGSAGRDLRLRAHRFEIPVEMGLQFGVVRLFGGVRFRPAQSGHSSAPQTLSISFNDPNVAVIGGLGLNIRKFFVDLRASGYPRSRVWQTFTSHGVSQRGRVSHDIVYGCSMGFFF